MNEVVGDELSCPFCSAAGQLILSGNGFTCQACEHSGMLSGHFCPDCSTYNEIKQLSCNQCSAILTKSCARCGRSNWSGYYTCLYCGNSLSIMETLSSRHSKTVTADRLESQMRQSKVLKAMEEVASGSRMRELESIESARRAHLAEEELQRRRRDRQLLIAAAVVLILFFVFLIVFTLLG